MEKEEVERLLRRQIDEMKEDFQTTVEKQKHEYEELEEELRRRFIKKEKAYAKHPSFEVLDKLSGVAPGDVYGEKMNRLPSYSYEKGAGKK